MASTRVPTEGVSFGSRCRYCRLEETPCGARTTEAGRAEVADEDEDEDEDEEEEVPHLLFLASLLAASSSMLSEREVAEYDAC